MCNSLCSVRVNIVEERPLVAIGRKGTDRIHDKNTMLYVLGSLETELMAPNKHILFCTFFFTQKNGFPTLKLFHYNFIIANHYIQAKVYIYY